MERKNIQLKNTYSLITTKTKQFNLTIYAFIKYNLKLVYMD